MLKSNGPIIEPCGTPLMNRVLTYITGDLPH